MPTFSVKAGKKSHEVRVSGNFHGITVDRVNYRVDFVRISPHLFSLILNGRSSLFYIHLDAGKATVVQDGIEHSLDVEDEYLLLLRAMEPRRSLKRSSIETRAPMPGPVTKVEVSKGVAVEEGAGLIVLEAMKMENQIRAPAKGTVDEVYIGEGTPVERGETLLSLTT